MYCPAGFADHEEAQGSVIRSDWRRDGLGSGLQSIGRTGANTAPVAAKQVRDSFKDYFISEEGQLSWQTSHVRSTGPTPNALDSYLFRCLLLYQKSTPFSGQVHNVY